MNCVKLFTVRWAVVPLIFFSVSIVPAFSQQRLIVCSSERNADNSISIISESQAFGDYTVKLIFSSLNDYTTSLPLMANTAVATVVRGRREILKLHNKLASASTFQYTYQYYPGRALRKMPDSSFVYLLPTTAGNSIRISKTSSLAESLGQKPVSDYFGSGFVYKQGDTICAARAGTVYVCNDDILEGEKTDDFYKSDRNKIHIQHNDGSLCTYDILAPIQLLVAAGDNVYPGKPLAVFNRQSEKYMVLFSTYYLDEKKLLANKANDGKPAWSDFVYIPTHFYTGAADASTALQVNNSYTVQQPKEIVTAELSKKEKKKLGY